MYCKTLVFCFLGQVYVILGKDNINVLNVQRNLMEICIVDILSSKSQHGSDVAVINKNIVTNDLIRMIHQTSNVKLFIKNDKVHLAISPSIFILLVQDLSHFQEEIDHLDKDWYRKPDALHIITLPDPNEDDLVQTFQTLWKYHIIHVLIIVHEMNRNPSIYSYFPYSEGGCGRDYNNTIKISDCNSIKNYDIMEVLSEYDQPVLTNCELQVATHNYPPLVISNPTNKYAVGIERVLLDIIGQMENISFNYTFFPESLEFGHVSDNFTINGILEKLYKNEMDVVIGAFALNNRRAVFFDFICSHFAHEDSFVTVTPSAGLKERWRMIYIVFQTPVWLLLLFVVLFCSIMLSYNHYKYSREEFKSSELFNLFGNAMQNMSLSLRRNIFKNLVIVYWMWFVFLVNCFYQTRLTSYTTFRLHNSQLNQYMLLYNYSFTPCFALDIAPFLKNSGQVPIVHEEYLATEGCETADLSMNTVAESQSVYTVTNYYRYLWWASKQPEKKEKVHLMREILYNALYAIFLKRGFPLLHDFNIKMLRLVEYGFVGAIKNRHYIHEDSKRAANAIGSFARSTLKLMDLVVPFGILITGLVFALIIFVIELKNGSYEIIVLN